MKQAKWIEIKIGDEWKKRILLDKCGDGVYCVRHEEEDAYINNNHYNRHFHIEEWREIKEPEYVQFDTIEEAKVLKDKWIKDKTGGEYLITGFDDDNVLVSGNCMTLEYLFEEFTYDGHPCGKLKEETK